MAAQLGCVILELQEVDELHVVARLRLAEFSGVEATSVGVELLHLVEDAGGGVDADYYY